MSISDRLTNVNGDAKKDVIKDVKVFNDLNNLQKDIHEKLVNDLGNRLGNETEAGDLKADAETKIKQMLNSTSIPLAYTDKESLEKAVINNLFGYGPLEEFLNDPDVTEVMVNGYEDIFVERRGKIYETDSAFLDDNHLRRIIDKIVSQVGRRIDESSPTVDARLPDGSRVNAVIPPLAIDGPLLTIRKFAVDPYTADDLISFGTLSPKLVELLAACIRGRLNIIVSGGTGTGKTTTLNVLSSFIPGDERVVTIEDSAELQLHQKNLLRLESRPQNIEGKGLVTVRDLVRNSLRMRPDRIIVGEVRGGESLDMLQAMNTGHDGSLSTVHSNSPRDTIARLETMVLMSGMDLPIRAIREQVAAAVNLIIHLTRLHDGSRRVTHVTEVQGMEGKVVTLQDIFLFDFSDGLDEQGMYKGEIKSTGIRPKFTERLEEQGIKLDPSVFDHEI